MVRKSYGKMRGTRKKLHFRENLAITRFLEKFDVGDRVHIDFSTMRISHPKFHGLTGEVIGKRGKSYWVKVKDKKSYKKIVVRPEHLKLQKNIKG